MRKFDKRVCSNLARYTLIAAITALLVGCGGDGGGGGSSSDEIDTDGDGIPDSQDPDADGDGIDDLDFDSDGDGIPDADDLNNNGIDDSLESDVEGDLDGDGFVDVSADKPCGGESGLDNASINNSWVDNCTLKRQAKGGQFADSLYTAGMQRVIYCAGFGTESSVTSFVDGEFGPGTENALIEYQESRFPDDTTQHDGIVGEMTWAELRKELTRETSPEVPVDGSAVFDGYSVPGERCGNEILFYQEVRISADGNDADLLGWTLAESPGSDQRVPFSIGSPFNQIE